MRKSRALAGFRVIWCSFRI
uniref:Uncharacterized protein n=1 Tax=Anguilla anguilla TaxID=7936 RepID=A0A0E9QLR3_ANGAN